MATVTPNGHALGLVLAPPDPRNWPYSFVASASPPPNIDHRPSMRAVGNQLQLGSCTGWGGTAALEAKLGDGRQRSPLYVYYYDRLEDGSLATTDGGATMLGLCKALKDYGAPTEEEWPYDPSRFSVKPPAGVDASAVRVDAYYQVQGQGLALLQGLWAALQDGPCPIALKVFESFETRVGSSGMVPMPGSNEAMLGGHCICACGWLNDPSAPGGYGWVICQNSWGEDHGAGGYYLLPAGYFTSGIVVEAWVIQVQARPPAPGPEPEDNVNRDEIERRQNDIRANVAYIQELRPTSKMTKSQILAVIEDVWTHQMGPFDDLARESIELLGPKVEPPPDPPDPPVVVHKRGFGVTYHYPGADHDPALDVYLGDTEDEAEWGVHWGHEVLVPADGVASIYQFGTPLSVAVGLGVASPTRADEVQYLQNHEALFRGVTNPGSCFYAGPGGTFSAQTMFFSLVMFDQPQLLSNGRSVRGTWVGHCRGDAAVGRVTKGSRQCVAWNSGVNFEANGIIARASHCHVCGTYSGQLTMNGEVSGILVARELYGWVVRDAGIGPGPNEYMSGQYAAGKSKAAFTAAGRPLPPPPPGQ